MTQRFLKNLGSTFLIASMIAILVQTELNAGHEKHIKSNEVPTVVLEAIRTKYPGVRFREWEKEDSVYNATCKLGAKHFEVSVSEQGNWLETEYECRLNDVPKAVLSAFRASATAQWKVVGVSKMSSPQHDEEYEIEVQKAAVRYGLHYDKNGTLLKKEQESTKGD